MARIGVSHPAGDLLDAKGLDFQQPDRFKEALVLTQQPEVGRVIGQKPLQRTL